MKKVINVSSGILASLLTVLFIPEYIKGLAVHLIYNVNVEYTISNFYLVAGFPLNTIPNFFILSMIFIIPLIVCIIIIELISFGIRRSTEDNPRVFLIVFQIVAIGYLIVNVIVGIIAILTHGILNSDWLLLLNTGGYSQTQKLIFMLLVMILLFGYINSVTGRMKRHIPIISQKSKKN